jgi:hypothetical protein
MYEGILFMFMYNGWVKFSSHHSYYYPGVSNHAQNSSKLP